MVAEVCVIGVPDELGEVPRAFVTLKNYTNLEKKKISDEIKEFADGIYNNESLLNAFNYISKIEQIKSYTHNWYLFSDQLASYKQIRGGLYVIDGKRFFFKFQTIEWWHNLFYLELPKGKTGKIDRNLVKQLPLPAY